MDKTPEAYLDNLPAPYRAHEHLVITVIIWHNDTVLGIVDKSWREDPSLCDLLLPTNMYHRGVVKESIHALGKELVLQWTGRKCFIFPDPLGEHPRSQKPTIILGARIFQPDLQPEKRLYLELQVADFFFAWINRVTVERMRLDIGTAKIRNAFEIRERGIAKGNPLWAV